jgi:hypothetical protein
MTCYQWWRWWHRHRYHHHHKHQRRHLRQQLPSKPTLFRRWRWMFLRRYQYQHRRLLPRVTRCIFRKLGPLFPLWKRHRGRAVPRRPHQGRHSMVRPRLLHLPCRLHSLRSTAPQRVLQCGRGCCHPQEPPCMLLPSLRPPWRLLSSHQQLQRGGLPVRRGQRPPAPSTLSWVPSRAAVQAATPTLLRVGRWLRPHPYRRLRSPWRQCLLSSRRYQRCRRTPPPRPRLHTPQAAVWSPCGTGHGPGLRPARGWE